MKTASFILVVGLVTVATALQAQVPPVDEKGVALGGYDVVAYFSGKAIKGDARITADYEAATYQFASAGHRRKFRKNPTQYLPEFDGYCAWGVGAKGATFSINPETFKVIDGKLYLFFNGPIDGVNVNTLELWNQHQDDLLKEAHTNWTVIKGSN
ncbi:MAG: YHS domain-containing (seleno)protein [Bacteroidia bacterium]|nr:YHS domain-containing (seleno)protein [Bacteroidia bacterium]